MSLSLPASSLPLAASTGAALSLLPPISLISLPLHMIYSSIFLARSRCLFLFHFTAHACLSLFLSHSTARTSRSPGIDCLTPLVYFPLFPCCRTCTSSFFPLLLLPLARTSYYYLYNFVTVSLFRLLSRFVRHPLFTLTLSIYSFLSLSLSLSLYLLALVSRLTPIIYIYTT